MEEPHCPRCWGNIRWRADQFPFSPTKKKLEEKELSPQTIRHCLSLIQRVTRRAQEWGHVKCVVPGIKTASPKFDNKRERFLSHEEAGQLLSCLSDLDKTQEWHDIALFALCTGLRKSEVFNLKVSHIDFAAQFLKIVDTKTRKNRVVPLNETSKNLLSGKKTPHQTSLSFPGSLQKPSPKQ
jgi:integrase